MKIEQRSYIDDKWSNSEINSESQLVLAFGSPLLIKKEETYSSLKKFYPNADIILTSTSWEILDINVNDNTISVSALYFEKTPIKVFSEKVDEPKDSFFIWEKLWKKIQLDDLSYSLIFSDWLWVNWSMLLWWVKNILWEEARITWWLAWDWADFNKTYVSLNGVPKDEPTVVIVCFYGESIKIWNSSVWGWNTFGIERTITKSSWNIVYEIDGRPILDLYKEYLWDQAQRLPGSWLMFPISIYDTDKTNSLVRTLLAVDEEKGSITFAWDVPENNKAFLMRSNNSKLIDWAKEAANSSLEKNDSPEFALLISCVWRKLVLKQEVEAEVEAVRDVIWDKCKIGGFYSYGELWVNKNLSKTELHNQTMTIALFSEK